MLRNKLKKRGKRALAPLPAIPAKTSVPANAAAGSLDRAAPPAAPEKTSRAAGKGSALAATAAAPATDLKAAAPATAAPATDLKTAAPATVSDAPAYDPAIDYSALMTQAAQAGDFSLAAAYERLRNAKIDGEGLSYEKTDRYASHAAPEGFASDYDSQLASLYEQLASRPEFSYDFNADALYRQYADAYTSMGQLAMQDTMGQAAALTGGYGSSYAQTVGQQAYDAYLQELSAVLPELYGQAADRYDAQTDALYRQYALLNDRREADYKRYQDAQENAAAQKKADYQNLVALISATGYRPTDAELTAAGLTRAQAQAYAQAYGAKTAKTGYGGGSSKEEETTAKGISTYERVKAEVAHAAATRSIQAALKLLEYYKPQLSEAHYAELFARYGNMNAPGDRPLVHLKPPLPYLPNVPVTD